MKYSIVASNFQAEADSSERGSILVIFGLIISAAVAIVAMVVDHSKQTLALNQLQISADAAALSAVKRLNGRVDGWQNAKLAAVMAIKNSNIHSTSANSLAALELTDGQSYGDAFGTNHPGQTGTSGELEVTVRRGSYWWDRNANNGAGGRVFRSFEEISTGEVYWVPTHVLANAIEVTVKLNSLATTLGRTLGFSAFSDLSKTAVAVSDQDLVPKVAPLAIPFCDLIRTTNPNMTAGATQDDQYKVKEQSKRTLVFTSADPDGTYINPFSNNTDSAEQQRQREGWQRFIVGQGQVYTNYTNGGGICYQSNKNGEYPSCVHTPIRGYMGVPTTTPGAVASVSEFAQALNGGVSASLGHYFATVEDLKGFDNDAAAVKSIGDFINAGQATVETAYFYGGVPKENFHGVKKIRQWPCDGNDFSDDPERRPCYTDGNDAVRTPADDPFLHLRIGWPSALAGGTFTQKMLMDRRTGENPETTRVPLDFTNPLCHHNDVAIDNLQAPVQKVLVMVIAPEVTEIGGKKIQYCDPEATFLNLHQQSAVPPVGPTHAKVVGFATGYVHDGNVQILETLFPPQRINGNIFVNRSISATPRYPIGQSRIVDRNPGELDIMDPNNPIFNEARKAAKQYADEHNEYHKCVDRDDDDKKVKGNCDDDDKKKTLKPGDVGGKFLGLPLALLRCFDFSEIFAHKDFHNIIETMANITPKFLGYANPGNPALGIPPSDPEYCLVDISDPSGNCIDDSLNNQMVYTLDTFFDKNIKAIPGTHCLPILNPGETDWNDPAAYSDLYSLKANRGCGGMIGALAIEGDIDHQQDPWLFATGGLWSQSSPILVSAN